MGYLTTSCTNSNVCKMQLHVSSAMLVDSIILRLLCTVSNGYLLSIKYSIKFHFLSELLQPKPVPRLRPSVNTQLLKYPTFKSLATLGDRSFSFAAPKLWNKLPCDIRNASNLGHFKRLLKPICLERPILGLHCHAI